MKTTLPKVDEIQKNWILVDATNEPVGRLAVKIVNVLRGKNKPTFTPHLDTGDHVVVINASKIKLTGSKEEQKIYKHYTGFPSGLRQFRASFVRETNPTRMLTQAVHGMLPKNRLGRQLLSKLRVYPGAEHPHEAQKPQAVKL